MASLLGTLLPNQSFCTKTPHIPVGYTGPYTRPGSCPSETWKAPSTVPVPRSHKTLVPSEGFLHNRTRLGSAMVDLLDSVKDLNLDGELGGLRAHRWEFALALQLAYQ